MKFERYQEEVSFAIRAVTEAATIAREVQIAWDQSALTKSDESPVTVADFAAQAIVAKALEETFPGDPLVAEEDSQTLGEPSNAVALDAVLQYVSQVAPGSNREQVLSWIDRGTGSTGRRFWVLDPVDGTKGFVRGGQYVSALGLIEDGEVVLGALGCPRLDEWGEIIQNGVGSVYIAVRGEGAWSSALGSSSWNRLRVSDQEDLQNARYLRSFEATHTDVARVEKLALRLGISTKPIPLDSQAKYAILASGGAELLLRIPIDAHPPYALKIWDYAAGSLLVEEAGGVVGDLRGNPLDFSRGRELSANYGILVSTDRLYPKVLAAVRELEQDGEE